MWILFEIFVLFFFNYLFICEWENLINWGGGGIEVYVYVIRYITIHLEYLKTCIEHLAV